MVKKLKMRKVIVILFLITPFIVKGQTIPMDSSKYFEGTLKTVCELSQIRI